MKQFLNTVKPISPNLTFEEEKNSMKNYLAVAIITEESIILTNVREMNLFDSSVLVPF